MQNHELPGLAVSFYCKHVVSEHAQIWIPFFDFWTDLTNNSYGVLEERGRGQNFKKKLYRVTTMYWYAFL